MAMSWWKEVVVILDALNAPVGEKSGAIPLFYEDGKRISPTTTFYRLGFDRGGFLRMGSGWDDDRSIKIANGSDIEISLVRVFVVVLTNGWA